MTEDLQGIQVPGWERFTWLRHGFSTRQGGLSTVYGGRDLNLGFTRDDDPQAVAANRERFLRAVARDDAATMVTVRQVHGTVVRRVVAGDPAVEADGMMTVEPRVMLGIQAADCVPVLVADVRLRVVAAIHAGWRGTAARIAEQGIAGMASEFGCRAEDMVAAVGPSIGACCYKVGDEVRDRLGAEFAYADELFAQREDGLHLDLAAANRRQLEDAGVPSNAVTVLGECTACARVEGGRKYFSHRAEKGVTGRAMGMIGIVSEG
jgi:YfiH family protein